MSCYHCNITTNDILIRDIENNLMHKECASTRHARIKCTRCKEIHLIYTGHMASFYGSYIKNTFFCHDCIKLGDINEEGYKYLKKQCCLCDNKTDKGIYVDCYQSELNANDNNQYDGSNFPFFCLECTKNFKINNKYERAILFDNLIEKLTSKELSIENIDKLEFYNNDRIEFLKKLDKINQQFSNKIINNDKNLIKIDKLEKKNIELISINDILQERSFLYREELNEQNKIMYQQEIKRQKEVIKNLMKESEDNKINERTAWIDNITLA
jgi:hypothetical protein